MNLKAHEQGLIVVRERILTTHPSRVSIGWQEAEHDDEIRVPSWRRGWAQGESDCKAGQQHDWDEINNETSIDLVERALGHSSASFESGTRIVVGRWSVTPRTRLWGCKEPRKTARNLRRGRSGSSGLCSLRRGQLWLRKSGCGRRRPGPRLAKGADSLSRRAISEHCGGVDGFGGEESRGGMGKERSQLREWAQALSEEKENPKMLVFASGSRRMKKKRSYWRNRRGRRWRWRY